MEWDGRVAGVWVTAPAAGGKANRAVLAALATWLDLPPARLRLVAGARSRTKLVEADTLELPPED